MAAEPRRAPYRTRLFAGSVVPGGIGELPKSPQLP